MLSGCTLKDQFASLDNQLSKIATNNSTTTQTTNSSGSPRFMEGVSCVYKTVSNGKCTIVRMEPRSLTQPAKDQLQKVYYKYSPDSFDKSGVDEKLKKYLESGPELPLNNNDDNYVGPGFIKKYNIKIGKQFDCYYKIMTEGGCNPGMMEIEGIKKEDFGNLNTKI